MRNFFDHHWPERRLVGFAPGQTNNQESQKKIPFPEVQRANEQKMDPVKTGVMESHDVSTLKNASENGRSENLVKAREWLKKQWDALNRTTVDLAKMKGQSLPLKTEVPDAKATADAKAAISAGDTFASALTFNVAAPVGPESVEPRMKKVRVAEASPVEKGPDTTAKTDTQKKSDPDESSNKSRSA